MSLRRILSWACVLCMALPMPAFALSALADDGDKASLLLALDRQREYLAREGKTSFLMGDRPVTREQLRKTSEAFARLVREAWGTPEFERRLQERFELLTASESAHVTGYHLPLLEARRTPDATFRFPLYQTPGDLTRVELGPFKPQFAGESIQGRFEQGRLVPYYNRSDIEDRGALSGKGLEIAWVKDELARFLLMVQGSGLLRFEDGSVRPVNYAGSNGRPYTSLGKLLVGDGKIPRERISVPAIKEYFAAHPDELHGYLVRNESYVFFRLAESGPFGSDGILLTPGRSVATDKKVSPSGAIAYLRYTKPVLGPDLKPTGVAETGRFVCDQDTGSAIKGVGRVDTFWGGGVEAEAIAGTLNATGSITYLLLKEW
ncbi:MAG TPA: MltA domain-containing protein [Stenomitos sp.]